MYTLIAKNCEKSHDCITKIDSLGDFGQSLKNANSLIDTFSYPIVEVLKKKTNKVIAVVKLRARETDEDDLNDE
jgi:hypothetical protein